MKGRGEGFEGRRPDNGDKDAAGSGVAGAASNTTMKPLLIGALFVKSVLGGIRLRDVKHHDPRRLLDLFWPRLALVLPCSGSARKGASQEFRYAAMAVGPLGLEPRLLSSGCHLC